MARMISTESAPPDHNHTGCLATSPRPRKLCFATSRRARPRFPSRTGSCAFRHRHGLVPLVQAEGIAFGVLAAGEPTNARDRLLVLRLAAQLAHLGEVGIDVVAPVVDDG